MKYAPAAFIAALLLATSASAGPAQGEFPWQIGFGIHLPPPPHR